MVCWQYFLSSCPSLFPVQEQTGGEGEEEMVKKRNYRSNLKLQKFLRTSMYKPLPILKVEIPQNESNFR